VSRLLTIADVAARLSCSQAHARRIAREIGIVKVGRLVRVRPADLDRYIADGGSCYDPIKKAKASTPAPAKDAEFFARLRERYGKGATASNARAGRLRRPFANRETLETGTDGAPLRRLRRKLSRR
jgi:excisionase family DNA binding protein